MRIRDARAEDHELFSRFFAELRVPDVTPDAARWVGELAPGAFFIEDEGVAVAYCSAFARGEAGHVVHVVVDPRQRRRGLGRALMDEAARRLRAAGCRRWFLNVRVDNPSAIALYGGLGMRTAHEASSLRITDAVRRALPPSRGITVGLLDEEAARAAEAKYILYQGSANRPPGIGLGAWRRGELCGAARFVVSWARSAPFKVDDETVVRALCDGMHDRLPAESQTGPLKVVLEGQAEIVKWLLKLGADEELRLLHLVGELPPE